MKIPPIKGLTFLFIALIMMILSYFYFFRIDLTSEKRFSICEQSKSLMRSFESPMKITMYLCGDLNPGFLHLKKSTEEMIAELSAFTSKSIQIDYANPSEAESITERERNYQMLEKKGLTPTTVYERDKEGKTIQKVIFPWLEIHYKNKNVSVCLLKNIPGKSGQENLNISIEELEFELTDGIRRVINREVRKIAFIEGHGELSLIDTYDICKTLSKYFQIDRGTIENDASVLNNYKAIIIAKPVKAFTENEKFIIDQYIMNGGNVLWMIDPVRIDKDLLSRSGASPAIANDLNIDDQLFRYGIRINPVLISDYQCVTVPVNIAPSFDKAQFEPTPFYFNPLLLTSPEHPITKNTAQVMADFCSSIDAVGDNPNIKRDILLISSDNSHIEGTPTTVELNQIPKSMDKSYFKFGYIPVAVSLEGYFESDFQNRMIPSGIINARQIQAKSKFSRQIFIADGDIIRNEIISLTDTTVVPLGYDRYANITYGNKEFILNSILYLTDNDNWMQLRNRSIKLRLLNKKISESQTLHWQVVNIVIPILILATFGILYQGFRKRKYGQRKKGVK